MRPTFVPISIALAMAAAALADGPPSYTITDLGRLTNSNSPYAYAISNTGRIVMNERDSAGVDHPIVWENGVATFLPMLEGAPRGISRTISDDGAVIGGSCGPFSNLSATIWTDEGVRAIGTLGGDLSDIIQVSRNGRNYTGYSRPFADQGLWHGFAVIDGVKHDIGPMPMYDVSGASLINDSGRVAGVWTNHKQQNVPFIWDLEHGIRELPTLGGTEAQTTDMNNTGQISGHSNDGLPDPAITIMKQLPVRWEADGRITKLRTLPDKPTGIAYGINARGECVGLLNNYATGAAAAVLWLDDKLIDLNTAIPAGSGWVLKQATDINDSGQIVGVGTLNGANRAYLLRPQP